MTVTELPPVSIRPTEARRQRIAVTVIFFLLGLVAGVWAARLPAIKAQLNLSDGLFGLVLFGPAVGAVVAMPVTGLLLGRVSPRRIVQVACVPLGGLLVAAALVGTAGQLFVVLMAWGAAVGMVDVAMNTEATRLQAQVGRRIMSRFHACYSIGGLAGAGTGALIIAAGIGVVTHFAVAAGVVMVAGVLAARGFSTTHRPPRETRGARSKERPAGLLSWWIVALCAMAFGCYLAEGAANDWSAVYLHGNLRASAGVAAIAYTVFSCAMAGGRLAGDHLAERFGPVRLIRTVGSIAAVGFVITLLIGQPVAAIVGFLLIGLGLSFVVPLVFTAAAQHERAEPSLALVSSCGYFGMLIGPVVIGGASALVGLPTALGLMALLCALAALLAPAVRRRRPVDAGVD